MKITAISITKSYRDENFKCTVAIDSEYGAMELKIPAERVQQVVDVVADMITDSARDVADNLSRQAMQHQAIEHQPSE